MNLLEQQNLMDDTSKREFLLNNIGDGNSVSLKEIKKYGKKESTANKFLDHFSNWKHDVIKDAEKYNFFEESKKVIPILLIVLITLLYIIIYFFMVVAITKF